jgi:hypothetical protein
MSRMPTLQNPARWTRIAVAGALLAALHAYADDAPAATIEVATAKAGFGQLVEGQMDLRGNDYVLTLRGIEGPARTQGTVDHLPRAQNIAGVYRPIAGAEGALRNAAGVTIRFDPPLRLESDQLEIELLSRRTPKISQGHREGGVE